jgi:hypothetical protein
MRLLFIDAWLEQPVACGKGLGSGLFKLYGICDAQAAGHRVSLLTSPGKAAFYRLCPALETVYEAPDEAHFESYDRLIMLGLEAPLELAKHPRLRGDLRARGAIKERYNQVPHPTYWRQLVAESIDSGVPQTTARSPLRLRPDDLAWARARLPARGPSIALSLSALGALKRYRGWASVAAALDRDPRQPRLILVGLEPPEPRSAFPASAIDLTGQTTVCQLAALLSLCQVVAGTDGLVVNLAAALDRPTVALFSIIAPEAVMAPSILARPTMRPLVQAGCPRQFCYPELSDYRSCPCPHQPWLKPSESPVCMGFAPELVCDAIAQLL